MTEGCLGAFHECLADIRDVKSGLVRRGDVVVDDRRQVYGDIVLRHANLSRHLDNLNPDIYSRQMFAEGVDFHETGVHCAFETTKLRHQANLALVNWLEGIRAAEATGDSTAKPNNLTQSVDWTDSSQLSPLNRAKSR
jgi:hypothetical protein